MSAKFPTAKLTDIAELNPTLGKKLPAEELVSFVPMASLSAESASVETTQDRPYAEVAKGFTPFLDGDVLVAKITPCFENGKIAQARLQRSHGFGSTEFHVVRARPGIAESRYLHHYLRLEEVRANGQRRMTGSGGQRRVPASFLADLAIPLPPLEEQRRIAAILDQAETLRTQRRTALALLDSLTQSLFLDMFGDPVANPKGWQRLPLSALVEKIDSGWSPVCLDRRAEEGEWAVLKLGAITSCEFKPQENKALPPDIAPVESIEVKPGDLLFSRKNTYELVAACALVNQTPARLMMSDLIFRFRLNASSAVIPQYLHRLLTYATKRQEVQKLAGGSAGSMPNISKAKLLDFLIEVPPLPLQKTFATRIASIEALKTTHRHALAALDALFASLQQRAFTGAL